LRSSWFKEKTLAVRLKYRSQIVSKIDCINHEIANFWVLIDEESKYGNLEVCLNDGNMDFMDNRLMINIIIRLNSISDQNFPL